MNKEHSKTNLLQKYIEHKTKEQNIKHSKRQWKYKTAECLEIMQLNFGFATVVSAFTGFY